MSVHSNHLRVLTFLYTIMVLTAQMLHFLAVQTLHVPLGFHIALSAEKYLFCSTIMQFVIQWHIPGNNSMQSVRSYTITFSLSLSFILPKRHLLRVILLIVTTNMETANCVLYTSYKKAACMFMYVCLFLCVGGINRAGAAVPTFLRTPTMLQPHLDMKPFLQFPMETPPPPHSMSLFHNFNTVRIDDDTNKHILQSFNPPTAVTKTHKGDLFLHKIWEDW